MADTAAMSAMVGGPAEPGTVLLAEHEPEVAELARRYLSRAGLDVRVTRDPDETTTALAQRSAAVAVLDLTMPGLDARRLRRLLAGRPPSTRICAGRPSVSPAARPPAVLLVGAGGPHPRRLGAAVDCLSRPFSPRTLVDRVLAAAAWSTDATVGVRPDPLAVGALTMNTRDRQVSVAGRDIAVTPAEFAVLAALTRAAGRVLTREQLLAAVHDRRAAHRRPSSGTRGPPQPAASPTGLRAVDVYVAQLRAKLPRPSTIRTVRGVGYVLDEPY